MSSRENTLTNTINRISDRYKANITAVSESVDSSNIVDTNANLIGITRTPTNIIFPEVALLRPTNSTVNTMLAITYLDNDLNDIRLTQADLSGNAGLLDKSEILSDVSQVSQTGQYFLDDGVIYKSLSDDPSNGGSLTKIQQMVFSNTVRQYSDNSKDIKFESFRGTESRFIISRWDQRVGSRKVFASISNELLDDIDAQGIDGEGIVEDLLLSASSEGINKDVIQKLVSISSKYNDETTNGTGVVDMSALKNITDAGRQLHYYATELAAQVEVKTHYTATYIIGSSRAVSLLTASGWLTEYDGPDSSCVGTIAGGKLKVYKDTQAKYDYMVAGFVHDEGEDGSSIEAVGSIVLTPYLETFGAISDITVAYDHKTMAPVIQMLVRYGIGTNPYTIKDNIKYDVDEDGNTLNSVAGYYAKADDWEELVGRSLASCSVGIVLPLEVDK